MKSIVNLSNKSTPCTIYMKVKVAHVLPWKGTLASHSQACKNKVRLKDENFPCAFFTLSQVLPKNACTKCIKFSCNATFLYIKFPFEKYATCVLYVFILSQVLQNMFRRICRRKHVWERSSSPKYMQASNGVHSASVKTKRKGMSIPFIQSFIYARGTTIFE